MDKGKVTFLGLCAQPEGFEISKKVSLLLGLALCLVLTPCTLRRQRPVLPEPVPENAIIRTIWVDDQALGFEQPADSTLEQIDALLSALGLEAGTPYDPQKTARGTAALRRLYRERGKAVQVRSEIHQLTPGFVEIVFTLSEE